MTEIVNWPFCPLMPMHVDIYPEYMSRPAQEATNGMRRSPGVTASVFRLRLIDVAVRDEAGFRSMQAMLALMQGNSGLVRIPLPDMYALDGRFSNASRARRLAYPNGVPFSSGVLFSGGTGFAVSTMEVAFAEDAALGATQIYLETTETLEGGCTISINEFIYITAGVWIEEGQQRVRISPPLRMAATAGDPVSLAPVFVGVCTTEMAGSGVRQRYKRGTFTFEFVEDLTRLVDLS